MVDRDAQRGDAVSRHYIIFSALFRPSIGGVENFTDKISQHLVAGGHAVTIVTMHISDNTPPQALENGVHIVRLPCVPLLGGRFPIPAPSAEAHTLWAELDAAPCDGVLVNTRFYPLSVLGVRFARKRGITPLVLEHGSAHITLGNRALDAVTQLYEHGITALIRRTDPRFYAVSRRGLDWLKHFGIEGSGVIPNAIDAAAWRACASSRDFRAEVGINASTPLIAFVGRLVPEKGVMQLVEAMRILARKGIAAALLVAGAGPLRNQLATEPPENVHVLGALTPTDIAALLMQADLYCLPSRSEGFAVTLLEAAACGTPPLVTDVGIARELAPNERFGTILPSAEPDAIAHAITTLIASPERLQAQGSAVCARVATHYSWDASAQLLIAAFDAAASDGAQR